MEKEEEEGEEKEARRRREDERQEGSFCLDSLCSSSSLSASNIDYPCGRDASGHKAAGEGAGFPKASVRWWTTHIRSHKRIDMEIVVGGRRGMWWNIERGTVGGEILRGKGEGMSGLEAGEGEGRGRLM